LGSFTRHINLNVNNKTNPENNIKIGSGEIRIKKPRIKKCVRFNFIKNYA
jgi:hypothetical protein